MDNNIRALRIERGISGAALARQVGKKAPALRRIERGEVGLTSEVAKNVARVLGVSVDEVVGSMGPMTKAEDGKDEPRVRVVVTIHYPSGDVTSVTKTCQDEDLADLVHWMAKKPLGAERVQS